MAALEASCELFLSFRSFSESEIILLFGNEMISLTVRNLNFIKFSNVSAKRTVPNKKNKFFKYQLHFYSNKKREKKHVGL